MPQCATKRCSAFLQRFSFSSWIFNPFWSSRLQKKVSLKFMHFYRPQGKEMLSQAFVSHSVRNRPHGYLSYWNAFLFLVTWFPQNMKLTMSRRGGTSGPPPPVNRQTPVKQQCIPVGCVPSVLYRTGDLCPGWGVSVKWEVSVQGGLGLGVSVQEGLCQGDPTPCEQNHRHV